MPNYIRNSKAGATYFFTISILIGSCLFTTPAFSASFDCAKASTWIEKAICSNSELSQLDDKMARQYQTQISSDPSQNAQILNEQRQWLSFQRDTCQTEACLIREYKERTGSPSYHRVTGRNASKLTADELPSSHSFGKFTNGVEITVYDFSLEGEDSFKIREAANEVSIRAVSDKPQLSVIEGVLVFNNGHMCDIIEEMGRWSENHWVIHDDRADKTAELRLYPATYQGKTQLLLRDLDNQYRETNCGMRGYFDGIVLERE